MVDRLREIAEKELGLGGGDMTLADEAEQFGVQGQITMKDRLISDITRQILNNLFHAFQRV